MSKQQFDSSTLQLARFDGIAKADFGGVSASVDYALYAAQPELGLEFPREGLTRNLGYKFLDRWSVDGSLVFDMSRHYYDMLGQTTPVLYPVGYSARGRLQGRMHDSDDQIFVQRQPARRLQRISRRSRHL